MQINQNLPRTFIHGNATILSSSCMIEIWGSHSYEDEDGWFWVVAQRSSMKDTDRRFREAFCLHNQSGN